MKHYTMSIFVTISVFYGSTIAWAGPKTTTYFNRNGSIAFRATENKREVRTYDNRGCWSGSYRKSGNSYTQTNKGFSSAKNGSSFIKRK